MFFAYCCGTPRLTAEMLREMSCASEHLVYNGLQQSSSSPEVCAMSSYVRLCHATANMFLSAALAMHACRALHLFVCRLGNARCMGKTKALCS